MENPAVQNETSVFDGVEKVEHYPTLLKRVQSTFIDGIITFCLIGGLVTVANRINDENVYLKIIAIIIGCSYEPIMNCLSGTIGQRVTGIKVIKSTESGKLNIIQSYIRYIIKFVLGIFSFLVVHINRQRRAIHDLVSGSVVVYR